MTGESTQIRRSKWRMGAGWTLTAFVCLFMTFDGVIKLIPIRAVSETLAALGYSTSVDFERGLGLLGLLCTLLYLAPRTSVMGAVLLTGYLGGAIASQLRVGNPLFSHLLFGFYIGAMTWAGLWLRLPALRAIFPVRPAAAISQT